MKFVAYLFLYKKIEGSELLNQTISDMLTYSKEVDTLYIFNYHRYPQSTLIDVLKVYKNIEYVDLPNKGQVANYSDAVNHAVKVGADFATVLETGYFMGKLGRNHVVLLADKGIEMPSDLSGVVYTNTANWQVDLLRELKAMGYTVDFNKLF